MGTLRCLAENIKQIIFVSVLLTESWKTGLTEKENASVSYKLTDMLLWNTCGSRKTDPNQATPVSDAHFLSDTLLGL